MYRKKITPRRILAGSSSLLLIIIGLTFLYPILWMLLISFKSREEIFTNPFGFPQTWLFQNYPDAIGTFDFPRFFLNSFIYTSGTILLTILCATLFAYAIARLEFKFKRFFLTYVQIGMVIPIAVIIISLYIQLGDMGLRNTHIGLILIYTASALPIAVTIFYGFFRTLPYELEESAFIEGCGIIRTFFSIILPNVVPAISVVSIIIFMNHTWNEFTIAFLIIDDVKMRSLPIALTYFISLLGTQWGLLGATMVLSSIVSVVVYLIASEKIENAIGTTTGIK